MPAKTKKPKIGTNPKPVMGFPPGFVPSQGTIAGDPPGELMQSIEPNDKRQGSNRFSPLLVSHRQPEDQALRPSSPFGVNRNRLAPEARDLDLDEPTLRRIATLDFEDQARVIAGIRTAGLPLDDRTVSSAIEGYQTLSITPGAPTPAAIEGAIAQTYLPSVWVTPSPAGPYIYEAQYTQPDSGVSRFFGYSPDQITSILNTARESALEEGPTYPTFDAPEYAPAEAQQDEEEEE